MGFSLAGKREFNIWLTETQSHYKSQYLASLADLVAQKADGQNLVAAVGYAQQYLAADPLAEHIHRRLIELNARRGERAAARRQFETCLGLLERELGVSPLPETYAAYKASQGTAVHATAKPVWSVLPSLELPLVGRQAAMEALNSAFKRLRNRGMLLVSGEAGVGITRLMQEFSTQVGRTILNGNSHPSTRALPYHPLVQALRQALTVERAWTVISEIWLAELTR